MMQQSAQARDLIKKLQSRGLEKNKVDPNSPERTLSIDNDFVDMSKVNILTSLHPSRKANRKILKRHNP